MYGASNPGSGAGLGSVIDWTGAYDYNNLTDAAGNPLNDGLTNYIHDVIDDPQKTAEAG